MKKILTVFLLLCFINTTSYAVSFDTSIDEKIRQNYDIEANDDLPALPNQVPTAKETPTTSTIQTPQYNPTGKTYVLKSGTKINLVLNKAVSSWSHEGSIVSFTSQNGIVAKDGTIIPAGTIFKGKITDSHPPQITGNGGLIEITIDEIYFNGIKSFIGTKICSANSKKVILGDIKGKRSYWKNVAKDMKPGIKVFNATKNFAKDLSSIPIVNIISVVSILGGTVFYLGNAMVAPVISVFQKGGNVTIPAGSQFQIKLTENSEIRG